MPADLVDEPPAPPFMSLTRVRQYTWQNGTLCVHADLADEPPAPGFQLLRMPLVQAETGPGGVLPFNSRRRRITGMAATAAGDLFVATKQVCLG